MGVAWLCPSRISPDGSPPLVPPAKELDRAKPASGPCTFQEPLVMGAWGLGVSHPCLLAPLAGFPGKCHVPLPRSPLLDPGLGPSHSVTSKPQDKPWRQGLESLLLRRHDRRPCPPHCHLKGSAHTVPSTLLHFSSRLKSSPPLTALHPGLQDQQLCSGPPGSDGTGPAKGLWEEVWRGASLQSCRANP